MIHNNFNVAHAGHNRRNTPLPPQRRQLQSLISAVPANDSLNFMLMEAATFVTNAEPQARELTKTLTNMQSLFDDVTAVSDNTDALRVRSFCGGDVPEHSVQIEQIATTQRNTGTALPSSEGAIPRGTHQFEIELDGRTHQISFTTTETLTNNAFQQQMSDAINRADIGINASVTAREANSTSILSLETESTGTGGNGEPRFTIRDVTGNAVEITGVGNIAHNAQDAIFTVDGELRTSASNDFELSVGLAVTLVSASESAVNITVGNDAAAIQNSVVQMVSQFNALLETARGNDLDKHTRSLINNLEGVFRRSRRSLQEIGIEFSGSGPIAIDEEKLQSASEKGYVKKFFGNTDGRPNGFIAALTRITDSVSKSPTRHISPHAARFPGFTAAMNAVANGYTLADFAPSPFDDFFANNMMGSQFNMFA